MILPTKLAEIFIEDIDLHYLKSVAISSTYIPYTPTEQKYLDFAHNHMNNKFMLRWSNGGTVGSCWNNDDDDLEYVMGDIEPDPTILLEFLDKYFPQLNIEAISAIKNLYHTTNEYESDYYGGAIEYIIKKLSFNELQEKLVDFLYKDELECVDFSDLLLENSNNIINMNIINQEDYFKYKLYKKMDANMNNIESEKFHRKLKI